MYVPRHFVEDDPGRMRAFIRRHPFGTLVTWDGKQPIASHLLMRLQEPKEGEPTLVGHMARANPQWKTFDSGREVLAIFQGPHTYVSAAWYSVPSAPTWNYLAVHANGTPRIASDREELHRLLKELVDSQEKASPESERYRMESLPRDLRESMMDAVVGFSITVTRIEAAAKLSQNLGESDHAHVIQKLKERGDAESLSVAREMEKRVERP